MQKKVDSLGVKSRPILSLSEMKAAAKDGTADECPSESLHESGSELVAVDDVSGQNLDPNMVT